MVLKVMKWGLRVLVLATVVLLVTNTAVGIGLSAADLLVGGVYLMQRNKCDRRQLHRLDLVHRY
ncbi:hypothetical protein ACFQ3L_03015 [Lacticaseibacillus jixianensis]|uniref:Uncharacterized protein n=1 Tax=Lacticaseibacillus jixianensis TaxID=2486012 RepID=A0ABW4B963_9LACO|nr:hypothetical protein [Lacticaseibacillus jixianensis]